MSVSTERRTDRAWVEVNLANLVANARAVRDAARDAALLPMVKANAYGLGARPVVEALEALEPWGFGVATPAEGVQLRGWGVERPVVVFTPVVASQLEVCRRYDLRPVLDDVDLIREWDRPYHCEVDTGMGRAGIRWTDREALREIAARPPEGLFTHFHSADTAPETVAVQVQRFREALARLEARPLVIHAANSAGVWHAPPEFDLVRPGIFLYGGAIGADAPRPQPVAAVRATLVSLRRLEVGDTVSYGAEWRAGAPTTVGTLAIGYADGVPRSVQDRAAVLVHGARCPVLGRVTMDMIVVDLTPVEGEGVQPGDVATLIGEDGDGVITLDEFAGWAGTISYEILTGLGARLPRAYEGP